MDLKETITNLRELEQSNKKYKGDATQYAFFRHALKLLGKLCKKEVETPIREPSVSTMKGCASSGYNMDITFLTNILNNQENKVLDANNVKEMDI